MVKHCHKEFEYALRSILSAYKTLLLNIASGMIENKTTFYNK